MLNSYQSTTEFFASFARDELLMVGHAESLGVADVLDFLVELDEALTGYGIHGMVEAIVETDDLGSFSEGFRHCPGLNFGVHGDGRLQFFCAQGRLTVGKANG